MANSLNEIGKLIDVSPRDVWQHEAHDFTPWLSENLDQLGEAIGLQLESEGTEVSVGPFSADILARDILGRFVLIENQLAATDHSHLGQILTYLSGLNADIVIWIATDFREPHLSAINWLNEHTSEQFSFFAIRLRVVRISDSLPAPVFDVLARPNQWERNMQKNIRQKTGESSQFSTERREFWQNYLRRYPQDENLGLQINSTSSNWLSTAKGIDLFISLYKSRNIVGVFLRGPRGTTCEEIQSRLSPHVDEFIQLVGDCDNIGEHRSFPSDDLKIDTSEPSNWDISADWLHERSHVFRNAINKIFG
ncbi:hypothetical protein BBM62_01225 [Vibrio parahaemolyticus]|uniref:hypothetical protein n=1 Tax=Vibrio parahaemolyticus TaxID=670 RepID=UPI00084AB910|nr:hypothetical protein [Vibrio parahaemolyticus]EJD0683326.1 hypothetical protein [Vibrio parahaemolyticus]EJI6219278.1 hypothetical protein [Vibrio parahaemolyticus]OEA50837.1 hypothetical protein BBM62_01225 [Vibrio parahaemolyticus]